MLVSAVWSGRGPDVQPQSQFSPQMPLALATSLMPCQELQAHRPPPPLPLLYVMVLPQGVSTLKQVNAALQALYHSQCNLTGAKPPVTDLQGYQLYWTKLTTLLKGGKPKGYCELGVDPQANTVGDTFTVEELEKLFVHLLDQADVDSARDLSIFAFMAGTISRFDDTGLLYLCDVMAPMRVECIGESCMCACFTMLQNVC